jgi:hypothetical protein
LYKCPSCNQHESFRVEVTGMVSMLDNGDLLFDNPGDVEVDNGHYCYCPKCDHDGIVEDFLVKETP